MDMLSQISTDFIAFLIVLTVLVFFHELGHFLIARWNGVKVDEFSIGFGPELFGFTDSKDTRWKFSLLPLGGYVKMYGDADAISTPQEAVAQMDDYERRHSLHAKSVGSRAAVAAAGPAANFLLAFVIFAVVFVFHGKPNVLPVIGEVKVGSAAEEAGLLTGDKVLRIDGQDIKTFTDIIPHAASSDGKELSIDIERAGEEKTLKVTPKVEEDHLGGKHYLLGVGSGNKLTYERLNPVSAVTEAAKETATYTWSMLKGVGQLISGARGAEELGGPLRIAQISGKVAHDGLVPLAIFIAIISINLALVNLLPVPALDGGHLLFYGIEALRGRPLSIRAQEILTMIGVIFILGLMVFSLWNDIVQLKVVEFFRRLF